jgi:hypothetical protein
VIVWANPSTLALELEPARSTTATTTTATA